MLELLVIKFKHVTCIT